MIQVTNKTDSLYVQLLKLLVFSAAAAFLVFTGLNCAGNYLIDQYYYESAYLEKRDQAYVNKLQEYIDRYALGSRDADQLYNWVKLQKMVSIRVYKENVLIFDSEYPNQELWEEDIVIDEHGWENYYSVIFSDGEAKISILGMYAYQFYNYAMTAELLLAFFLFLTFVLLGIRKKMEYIRTLCGEIELLESGSLDYRITVKGKDELAALAESLDHMRMSFRNLIQSEAQMVQENQKAITEMSHDLRTPVTSILLYTEILKKGRYKGEEQMKEYIEKIDRKAYRMKQLTDHLFEYSLVTGGGEVSLEEPESFSVLFYDLFSETCSYLEQRGFRIQSKVEWKECRCRVYTDYVTRIMDNITSNIIKYADPQKPVVIQSVYQEYMAGFSFKNAVYPAGRKVESASVGIQSIRNMMKKMGGTCRVWQSWEPKGSFKIEVLFPVYRDEGR